MALSASSSCRSLLSSTPDQPKVSTSGPHDPQGVTPLPAKPTRGSGLRRKKSLKPVNAGARDAAAAPAKRSLSEEIATASEEILDAMDAVMEKPAGRRTSGSKANSSRTSRRRALVMCLALGMVRPCVSDVAHQEGLRRTVSEAVQRTASQMQVPLVSQVSLATTMKQPNFMGEPQDLQKLTTLQ
jgi:hypothetical protein